MARHPVATKAAAAAASPRRRAGAAAVVLTLALLLALCTGTAAGPRDDSAGPSAPGPSAGPPRADLGWGFTHTRASADGGTDAARRRAVRTLTPHRLPQNQHLMGWGAENPEPSPGRYDFAALDSRIAFIRETQGVPVLTLCCAPDWMKGGRAGHTDWDDLEKAPLPEHYANFARLAGHAAQRYPQVRHFLVWNELKGFFDDERGRWDHEGYTELYNLVYAEVKRVRPDALVGGPYVVMDSVTGDSPHASAELRGAWGSADQRALDAVRYWNTHRIGADFVVVDASSYTKDRRLLPDAFGATAKFTDIGRWVRGTTGLPLWWAEWYVEPGDAHDRRDDWTEGHRLAVQAAGLIAMARGGADTGLYWNPQLREGRCPGCLWEGTGEASGGGPLPILDLLTRFATAFGPGTGYESVTAHPPAGLHLLADDRTVLAVNPGTEPVRTRIDGRPVELAGHEVRWLDR
ncbi:xylan 1,4-beta-xylosidase [Streptomyces sp. TRM 70351]|uniref:xylan 1,4-beta-xylosidase n=1 Tax=Streptomyces sp. TRM 70351 TaxID=3116552 RepID=UPI002E7BC435|nr:xylan 1,4-beta-xylosidase [Streptomyces sp. TRM 70351]MEE1929250.1 xylan 1,4-beta-xylosidase [Streptomyces sp. TRM 70351]